MVTDASMEVLHGLEIAKEMFLPQPPQAFNSENPISTLCSQVWAWHQLIFNSLASVFSQLPLPGTCSAQHRALLCLC